jgi:hypothetical protein
MLAAPAAQAAGPPTARRGAEEVPAATAPAPVGIAPHDERDGVAAPSRAQGATVARIVAPTFARRRLDAPRSGWAVSTQTAWSRQPQVLLVLDAATRDGREWVKVLLANRPNGSAGWIPRDHHGGDAPRESVDPG